MEANGGVKLFRYFGNFSIRRIELVNDFENFVKQEEVSTYFGNIVKAKGGFKTISKTLSN